MLLPVQKSISIPDRSKMLSVGVGVWVFFSHTPRRPDSHTQSGNPTARSTRHVTACSPSPAMANRTVQTSKFLSYVLRHNPGALGLHLDPGGWADVDTLLDRAQADGRSIDRSLLKRVIAQGEKERFALSDDETKIRANYGHSIDVDLDLTPTVPPEQLYHGTARQPLPAIQKNGLRPQSRQYVHLSSTRDEAVQVGSRHGTPVVLTIDAQALYHAGTSLYPSTDAVWLTERVPPQFLHIPDA